MLYSIGHSNHPFEHLVALLRRHGIATVADVRARPFSRHVPHVSKHEQARRLAAEGLGYAYLGRELGGLPPRHPSSAAAPTFAERARQPAFEEGLARLLELAAARPTAMLCRERDPLDCHRFQLIGRALRTRAQMRHILPDGRLEDHPASERRLLERAGEGALPLFPERADDDAILRAYEAAWPRFR